MVGELIIFNSFKWPFWRFLHTVVAKSVKTLTRMSPLFPRSVLCCTALLLTVTCNDTFCSFHTFWEKRCDTSRVFSRFKKGCERSWVITVWVWDGMELHFLKYYTYFWDWPTILHTKLYSTCFILNIDFIGRFLKRKENRNKITVHWF